jgi:hypothetical protein
VIIDVRKGSFLSYRPSEPDNQRIEGGGKTSSTP